MGIRTLTEHIKLAKTTKEDISEMPPTDLWPQNPPKPTPRTALTGLPSQGAPSFADRRTERPSGRIATGDPVDLTPLRSRPRITPEMAPTPLKVPTETASKPTARPASQPLPKSRPSVGPAADAREEAASNMIQKLRRSGLERQGDFERARQHARKTIHSDDVYRKLKPQGQGDDPGVIRRALRNIGGTVGTPLDTVAGGRLSSALKSLGLADDESATEALGAATLAGAGGGAAGLGAMKIRSAQKARAAAAAKAQAAQSAAGGGAGLGKLLQKLVTKRASVLNKVAHLNALDEAATERAIEMMKIAQDMESQGEELTFDDVMELTNPDGSNFLEGLVTDLAMAKLDENGFTE